MERIIYNNSVIPNLFRNLVTDKTLKQVQGDRFNIFYKKIMKLLFVVLSITFLSGFCYAEPSQQPVQAPSPTTPQFVAFNQCSKIYPVNSEKLFYETLSAISANKFTIKEIQSRNGYIMFSCGNKIFITTIATVDNTHSIIKVSPCDNNYFFPPGIISNIYKYLDISFNRGNKVNSSSAAQ